MRFKTGLIVGLAVGYYYGAKAGRERYQQIDHYLAQVRASEAYRELRDRVGDLVDDGVSRARSAVEEAAFGGSSPTSGDPTLN